jgi:hypothetical protein
MEFGVKHLLLTKNIFLMRTACQFIIFMSKVVQLFAIITTFELLMVFNQQFKFLLSHLMSVIRANDHTLNSNKFILGLREFFANFVQLNRPN